jgi:hypothetical protein
VPLRSAIATVDFQQRPLADEVTDRHRLEPERLGLAAAACPVLIALKLYRLRQAGAAYLGQCSWDLSG